jgi:hypothetical protein
MASENDVSDILTELDIDNWQPDQSIILIASDQDRHYLLQRSKKGFTASQRRECWLLATGAL